MHFKQKRALPPIAAMTLLVSAFAVSENQESQQQSLQQQQQHQRMAIQGDTLLESTLSGFEQVGGQGSRVGSATATITLRPVSNEVCYNVIIRGIAATQAHIHRAPKGENGPVTVAFMPPRDSVSTGCSMADPSVVTDLMTNPTRYYVNVRNADYPQGALRGQLSKPLAPVPKR